MLCFACYDFLPGVPLLATALSNLHFSTKFSPIGYQIGPFPPGIIPVDSPALLGSDVCAVLAGSSYREPNLPRGQGPTGALCDSAPREEGLCSPGLGAPCLARGTLHGGETGCGPWRAGRHQGLG